MERFYLNQTAVIGWHSRLVLWLGAC